MTSPTSEIEEKIINILYPGHAKGLAVTVNMSRVNAIKELVASQTNNILSRVEDEVVNSDRPYTNENDRKVANHYKLQLLKALKQMRNE